MEHHNLDIDPIPNESKPLFINEPYTVIHLSRGHILGSFFY